MKKFLFAVIAALTIVNTTNARDFDKFSVSGGAELVANYNFRGINIGGFSLQPWVELSSNGVAVGAWGSIGSMPYSTEAFKTGNYELDVYLSYTTPLDIFTIKVTHLYYFNGSPYFDYSNDCSSSTQTELEGKFRWEGLSVGVATQVGGGDCYSLYNNYYGDSLSLHFGDPGYKMWSTYLYVIYDWEIDDCLSWRGEIGLSPHRSQYTYYNANTGDHAKFALNNISSTFTFNHYSNDIVSMYFLAEIHFNLFDVGYDKFKYGKNFGWNIGLGVEL